jgi:hypothetical protein
VGHDTLSQDLGPLHKLQGRGGVDRQCDLEVLCHATKVAIKASEMAKHIGLVQCGHLAQAREGKRGAQCLELKTPLKVVYVGETKFQKEVRLGAAVMSSPMKGNKTFKRGSSLTSTCEMDYCGISKSGSMFQNGG